MTGKVRIGIVGCGEATQVIHLPTLRHLRERFAVTALCDVSRHVLDTVGDDWNVEGRWLDWRDLVATAEVDAVLIANPHVFHAEVADAAMAAGKHVLIEKPMCLSIADADRLIAREAETGVVAQVGFMRRYAPDFTKAVELVRNLPEITHARVRDIIGRNALIVGRTANVVRPVDLGADAAEALRRLQSAAVEAAVGRLPAHLETSYMMLLGLASHDISAMREMLGLPKGIVYAASRAGDGRTLTAAFDYGSFVCHFETTVDEMARFDSHIEVFGRSRVIRVDYNTPYIRNIPGRLVVLEPEAAGGVRTSSDSGWQDAFTVEWSAFHDSICGGPRPKTSLADAREDLVLFREMIAMMAADDKRSN